MGVWLTFQAAHPPAVVGLYQHWLKTDKPILHDHQEVNVGARPGPTRRIAAGEQNSKYHWLSGDLVDHVADHIIGLYFSAHYPLSQHRWIGPIAAGPLSPSGNHQQAGSILFGWLSGIVTSITDDVFKAGFVQKVAQRIVG